MPLTLEQVLALAATSAVIILVPGPSVLFVVGRALAHGRAAALASVLGNSLGSLGAALVIAVGLGPVLQRWDVALEVVKLAGAAYLVLLGVQALRGAGHTPGTAPGPAGGPERSAGRAVRAGVLVGVSNPKVFVLFAAVLPQFVDPAAGPVPVQMALLSLVPVLIGLVCDSGWGLLAARVRSAFLGRPARLRTVTRVGGASMIALGVVTAVTGRHR
ncbi:LysE family translocator [Kineococcus rhizosphaerae]|uniref:Threonine/homoserine/homoserine lactone efflux protein n=1 Tax=Kineococcus rhizosphaerae TaxID=559628 RepID=A0A2T0R568_9ACTN|nr:LysE family translocator [Kineococcus rhizosphaerae]PRY15913.1 threonine/homoserine/homoserine lactone efflux protein [Kineococcus rhizosphaerae]